MDAWLCGYKVVVVVNASEVGSTYHWYHGSVQILATNELQIGEVRTS